jgi:protein-disulfide isomerase
MRQRLLPVLAAALVGAVVTVAVMLVATPRVAAAQSPMLPARGPADAKIVIMIFADLASPDIAKAAPVLAQLREQFPADVQVVFKHNPAPGSAPAAAAHEAVVEAARQGKFWEMVDRVAATPDQLQPDQLAAHAKALGLDAAAFTRALEARTHRAAVERDALESQALGATGGFALFINGRRGNGVPPPGPLASLIKNLISGGDGSGPAPVDATTFDLSGAAIRGDVNAPVTLVEFSDFQCGFCLRVNATLTEVLAKYPGKVRIAFKHYPIEGHNLAPLAHRAAMAAQEQGKFWEMHDRVFANQRQMARADLLAHATALGLDMPRFTAALDGEKSAAMLARDKAEGDKVGVDGTPTFFINGKPLVGAVPLAAFSAAIDAALAAKPAPATR